MHHAHRILGLALAVSLLTLTACAGPALETPLQTATASPVPQDSPRALETPPPTERPTAAPTPTPAAPILQEMDGAEFFGAWNGAAVLYDPAANRYEIYHPDLAQTRRSPCSTFKILSSLIGLETGGIDPQDSTRAWSGDHGVCGSYGLRPVQGGAGGAGQVLRPGMRGRGRHLPHPPPAADADAVLGVSAGAARLHGGPGNRGARAGQAADFPPVHALPQPAAAGPDAGLLPVSAPHGAPADEDDGPLQSARMSAKKIAPLREGRFFCCGDYSSTM